MINNLNLKNLRNHKKNMAKKFKKVNQKKTRIINNKLRFNKNKNQSQRQKKLRMNLL